jgi:hypothetical protein
MDDATSEIYSALLVDEEGTMSSFRGLVEVIERRGLFMELYTDRGSHYFFTPEAGGKVSRTQLTQVGRALKQLGIGHIPAYSPLIPRERRPRRRQRGWRRERANVRGKCHAGAHCRFGRWRRLFCCCPHPKAHPCGARPDPAVPWLPG